MTKAKIKVPPLGERVATILREQTQKEEHLYAGQLTALVIGIILGGLFELLTFVLNYLWQVTL